MQVRQERRKLSVLHEKGNAWGSDQKIGGEKGRALLCQVKQDVRFCD
jgi:hypothetical protein